MKMNKKLLGISGVVLGVTLFSSCTPMPKFHSFIQKVEQDSENVVAHISMRYTESLPTFHLIYNKSYFQFLDKKGKDYWIQGDCGCKGVILNRGETKIIQYKIPKASLPKGIYYVYPKNVTLKNKYKTIEIK